MMEGSPLSRFINKKKKIRASGRKFRPEAIQGAMANQSSPPAHADGDLLIGSCGVWLEDPPPQQG